MKIIYILLFFIYSSCTTKVPNHFKANRTLVFTDYGSISYEADDIDEYINALKSMKSRKASLLYTCYTKNQKSHNIDCDSYDSPVRKKVSAAIKKLKSLGFDVSLRVYVDLQNQKWRAKWDPVDKNNAFKNLEDTLIKFALFAAKHKVDHYIIGSEYERLTRPKYTHKWEQIIKLIKEKFKGSIIYAANGNISTFKKPEYEWIGFWQKLGSIGVNHYPPLSGKPSYKRLLRNHKKYITGYINVASKLGLPVHFTEVGFPLSANGHAKPYTWIWDKKVGINKPLQTRNLKSFLSVLEASKYSSIYFWRHMPREINIHPQGYLMSDKETLKLISQELDN